MIQADTIADTVFRRLKAELLEGAIDLHTRLDIAQIAERYRVSPTPVREAAMRLLGEGLLEQHPRGGTRPLQISEYGLRTLLELHGQVAEIAIRLITGDAQIEVATCRDQELQDVGRCLFDAIAQASANANLVTLVDRLADRLSLFRLVEPEVFASLEAERETIIEAAASGSSAGLRRAVRSYHRRRLAHVPELAWHTARRQVSASQP